MILPNDDLDEFLKRVVAEDRESGQEYDRARDLVSDRP